MSDNTYRRREFFSLASSATLALFLPSCGDSRGARSTPSNPPASHLPIRDIVARYFGDADPEAIRHIGEAWLRATSLDSIELDTRLQATAMVWADAADTESAAALLHDVVAAEYTRADLESLHGWQVCPTELTLAALWVTAAQSATM